MVKTTNKRGFNLIEIAIVLAVIGLVIGGIYVAASAVTENNRRQATQKQLLQIVQNVRTSLLSQNNMGAANSIDYATAKALGIMPGDLVDTGSATNGFQNAYNGKVSITNTANDTKFTVTFAGLSAAACTDLLAKSFGNINAVNQVGLKAATGNGTDVYGTGAVTASAAAGACNLNTNANVAALTFNLH